MTKAVQVGEAARDGAYLRRRFKTDAAVFLHDDRMIAHLTSVRSLADLARWTDAIYPCADDFKFRIERHEVRPVSGRNPSKLALEAQKSRGSPRGHDEGIDKGNFEQR